MSERIPLMGSKEGKGVMYSGHNEETSHLYPLSSAPIEVEKEDHIQSSESDQEPEDTYINSLNAKEKQEEIREGIRTGSLFLIGILAVGVMLVYLQFILIPLVFSRFLVYIFQPLVNLFIGKKPWPLIGVKTNLPRLLAVSIVLLLIVALLAALGVIIFISVKQVLNHSDSYLEQLTKWEQLIVDWAKRWGYTEEELKNMLPEIDWSSYVVKLLGFFADLIPQMFLIVLFVVYMLLDFDATKQKTELRHSIDEKIRRYILVHSLVALGMGVGTWVILEAMSINLALFFGLMAFILEYIPNIGSVVAVLLPMPLVVLDPEVSWIKMLLTFFLPALLHFLLGQVLEPRILGHVMEIPALTVLVCLMFWGSVWGIIGAILSVPLTVAVKLYLETIDHPMPRFLATIITNLGCD